MPHPGQLIVISGPSGAGKTTVIQRALEQCQTPGPLELSVSATTRPRREGEQDGVNYHFLTREQFQQRRQAGDFLECFEYSGNWYGTLAETVSTGLAAGKWIILEIEVQGAAAVMELHPEAISIFIRTRSLEELQRRLSDRGTESEETIALRMETARREWAKADTYQHQVINENLDDAVRQVCTILSEV